MPKARQRNDTSTFFSVEYTQTGEKVRIETIRFTGARQDAFPLTLVVGAGPGGKWLILEEYSESRQD